MRFLIHAVLLSACASAPVQPAPSPQSVIQAERAFAADAAERGWVAAFRRYAAADALQLSPDPVNAQENLATIEGDGSTALDWRPAFAGVAQSDDLGFTTGPFLFRGREGVAGHYFTVWRRQADGGWKWVFDAGVAAADPGPVVAPDADIPVLATASEGRGQEAALADVTVLENQIASSGGVETLLAEDVRLNRSGAAPAVGASAARALLARDEALVYHAIRRDASLAGDLVFSLGDVRAAGPGGERLGYAARVWQLRPDGWRIVFDEIVPRGG